MNVLKKARIIFLVIALNFFFVFSSYANNIQKTFDLCLASFQDNGNKKTMWHTAAENGHIDVLEFLAEQGIDVNFKDSSGKTALEIAVEKRNRGVLEFLVAKKIDDSSKERAFETALKKDDIETAEFLISQAGVDINFKDSNGKTNFERAVDEGNKGVLKFLSKRKISGVSIERAFERLLEKNDIETAEFLTSLGIKISEKIRAMALRIAIKEDNIDILKFLKGQGKRIDLMSSYRGVLLEPAAFIKAVEGDAIKVAKYFIKEGLHPSGGKDVTDALIRAVEKGDIEMAKLLLSQARSKRNRRY